MVRRMGKTAGGEVASLIGNAEALRSLRAADFVDEMFGLPTVTDILKELEKPGRDPGPRSVRRPSRRVSRSSGTWSPAWCWRAS